MDWRATKQVYATGIRFRLLALSAAEARTFNAAHAASPTVGRRDDHPSATHSKSSFMKLSVICVATLDRVRAGTGVLPASSCTLMSGAVIVFEGPRRLWKRLHTQGCEREHYSRRRSLRQV
jgi:hypothetical protein